MKIFTNKNLMQKIIIAMIFVIFFNFAIPNTSACEYVGNTNPNNNEIIIAIIIF